MKKLEIVCIGNNGRSPIAEPIFRDEAQRQGLENEIEITSSGAFVETRHPYWLLKDIIKKAINNPAMEIYGSEQDIVKQILDDPETQEKYVNDPKFRERFHYFVDQAYRPLQSMDTALRNNVLARHGLRYESERNQFPSRDGLDYALTATKMLVEPVRELAEERTIVTSLGQFTDTGDLKGGFGKFDITFYEGLYRGMKRIAPRVLEKVLEG